MPREAGPRALIGVLVLILALAVAIVPAADARPKDKKNDRQSEVAAETGPDGGSVATDAPADSGPAVEQPLTAPASGSNERTLLDLDSDGDYIPDALDNCPSVQNPDQADGDGDGNGDACYAYQDLDGDGIPDKDDNCPNIATSDFSDRDGDGIGDSCDKSPDGVEPEPEPLPEYLVEDGEDSAEPPPPENGANQDGVEVEKPGRTRTRERSRTDRAKPIITTGVAQEGSGGDEDYEGTGGPSTQDEPAPDGDEQVRDNPRINEELIEEAAAAGEIYDPAPPPVPQKAWDDNAPVDPEAWDSIVRIDAGATDDAASTRPAASGNEPNGAGQRGGSDRDPAETRDGGESDISDSEFAHGWVRAKLLLQDELAGEDDSVEAEPLDEDPVGGEPQSDQQGDGGSERSRATAPVPVENGLVITGNEGEKDKNNEATRDRKKDRQEAPDPSLTAADDSAASASDNEDAESPKRDREQAGDRETGDGGARRDGSRRNGSSRGPAAAAPSRSSGGDRSSSGRAEPSGTREQKQRDRKARKARGVPKGWSDDRYFDGGAALDWGGDIGVAGTNDDSLYLTQRSGSGPGKRRGFEYAIPVDANGVYLVRLCFAEPYWGAPGGPDGAKGRRVFSVTAEGAPLIEDLDIYAEAGSLTALVKQAEVDVEDGELNLVFTAAEGEPVVAAIEILEPAE